MVLRGLERAEPERFLDGQTGGLFQALPATAEAIKSVDAGLRVGGPVTARTRGSPEFLDFCEQNDVPGRFREHALLPDRCLRADRGRHRERNWPTRRAMSCANRRRRPATRRGAGPALLHRVERLVQPARSAARRALHGRVRRQDGCWRWILVEGYSFWTFSDIFEENYFPSVPFQGGFGLLNLHGIAKPSIAPMSCCTAWARSNCPCRASTRR